MVGYLSKKPKLSLVDDPGKLCRQRRRATQATGLETLDPEAKVDVTPNFTRKTECISYVRQDHLHTHDRQNESNTIAVI
jgi:hypothetical protein